MWTILMWLVLFAEKLSEKISMLGRSPVPAHVVCVTSAGSDTVYNLTVDGEHEYFANGILVSNCDSLRYCGASMPIDHHTLVATI